MAQQVGSGAAPAASETEAAPGGASGMTEADARLNGAKASQKAGHGVGQGARASQGDKAPGASQGDEASQGQRSDIKAGRVRGWLRRNPPAATVTTAPQAPSVVAAGPELDLASNDPLVGLPAQRGQRGGHHRPPAAVPGTAEPCRKPAWSWWSR